MSKIWLSPTGFSVSGVTSARVLAEAIRGAAADLHQGPGYGGPGTASYGEFFSMLAVELRAAGETVELAFAPMTVLAHRGCKAGHREFGAAWVRRAYRSPCPNAACSGEGWFESARCACGSDVSLSSMDLFETEVIS